MSTSSKEMRALLGGRLVDKDVFPEGYTDADIEEVLLNTPKMKKFMVALLSDESLPVAIVDNGNGQKTMVTLLADVL